MSAFFVLTIFMIVFWGKKVIGNTNNDTYSYAMPCLFRQQAKIDSKVDSN